MLSHCSGRSFVGLVLLVIVFVMIAAWIMGDDWKPLVQGWKTSARHQLQSLVDERKFVLAKARQEYEEARKAADQLTGEVAAARIRVEKVQRDLRVAEREIDEWETQLAAMADRLQSGQAVRLVSGRVLTTEETRLRVENARQRRELAREKCAFLESLLRRHQALHDKLVTARNEAPIRLAHLRLSLDFLADKITFYEVQLAQTGCVDTTEPVMADVFARAQQTLETAHDAVNMKLAECEAILEIPLDDPIDYAPDVSTSEDLLAEIHQILGENDRLAMGG